MSGRTPPPATDPAMERFASSTPESFPVGRQQMSDRVLPTQFRHEAVPPNVSHPLSCSLIPKSSMIASPSFSAEFSGM